MANLKNSPEAQKILGFLSKDHVKTVVLFGEAGVGKTWMAKKISNFASRNGYCYGAIWVVQGCNNESKSLVKYIAIQLSVVPSDDEREEDDNTEMKQREQVEDLKTLERRIQEKLKLMKPAKKNQKDATENGKGPYILVVLDDFDDKDYQEIYHYLDDLLRGHHFKILITKRDSGFHNFTIGENKTISYEMKFLSHVDSSSLLQSSVKEDVSAATGFERLSTAIGKSSAGRPGVIVMIAEAMNRVKDSELDIAVEEMASIIESADDAKLWQHVYQMLPSTLSKCCWHCRYLFLHHKRIHYIELITHWLLEGYFDHHDHIETAYEEAHHTLMELKGRGFLREKEDSYITMESDALRVNDHRCDGLSGSAYVGVASMLDDQSWAGLWSIIQTDGMMKTKTSSKKGDEMSTLFIDGTRFRREVPETFFQHKQQLKVLVIIYPMFEKVPSPLSKLKELQVLVLRGCRLLTNVDEIHELTNLLVLEISGAHKVKEIRDDFFVHMKDLRSLNLSEVGIKWLPASLLNQSKLRWLVLRKCPNLERLCDDNILEEKEAANQEVLNNSLPKSSHSRQVIFPPLKKQKVLSLAQLEVLDLSGSSSFHDIQVKTLSPLEKLQTLNLSKTKIERLPLLHGLGELTRLLLSDCPSLGRLPSLKPLLKLEILDFSKRTSLKKIQEDHQGNKDDSRVPDPPGRAVIKLPPNISSLSHLLLSGRVDLPKLPSTQGLQGLEELNLSDASMLEDFEDHSFEHLKSLRRLILSNTKIKALPSLSQDSELRLLLLRNCKFLTKLENLSLPQKLEVLDLSGCSELVITSNDSFRGMSHLKTINLSETKIKSLPRDCFPVSLRHLIIRNCPHWNTLPYLEHLLNLEVLDLCGAKSLEKVNLEFLRRISKLRILNLSEIKFEQLPSLSHFTKLRELSLRGCSCKVLGLDALKELKLLDLSGTKVGSLPPLETFSKLQQLLLGDCADLKCLKNLKFLTELEILDLSGTKIQEFPYEISDLTSLRKINLQNMEHIKEIDWNRIKYVPEEFNLGGCGFLSSETAAPSDGPSIIICGTRFFQFVEENRMWDTYFKKFHFSVWLPKNSDGRIYELRERGLLMDLDAPGIIPHCKEVERYLEIHGSSCFSSIPEHVLEHADHISLLDDCSLTNLSELFKKNLRSIKSCCLDRCTDISSIIDGENDARASGKLDSLHLHNLSSLSRICTDSVQSEVFGDLKHLHIDCCPMLTNIFPLSKLPKKLETLQIKFCEKLETIVNPDMPVESNLRTLDLLELPNLKRIRVTTISLRELKVRRCPNLETLEEVLGEAENLKILHIFYAAMLKRICSQIMKPGSFKNLKQLKIEQCPKLENLEGVLEEAESLEILHISYAAKLKTMCSGEVKPETLKNLEQLKIEQCPKLENLEGVLGEAENLKILHISYAAELKTICSREVKPGTFKNLKQLKIEYCPQLKEVSPSSKLPPKLEILEIDSCESLETIFRGRSAGYSLKRLWLWNLPSLMYTVFKVAPQCHADSNCPRLRLFRPEEMSLSLESPEEGRAGCIIY